MNYLSVEQLTKKFQDFPLARDLTFGISQGEKVALVGKNGCGKSTLLRMIAGQEDPDSGKVVFKKDITIGFLSQEPELNAENTVKKEVFYEGNEALSVISQYEEALHSGEDAAKIQELVDKIDALKAWDYEHQVHEILGRLGVEDLDQKINELSGGQKKRVALAKTLINSPDFLILDEPTNHLDIDAIEWLEKYLSSSSITLLMITHDRYFLESVCNKILELDEASVYRYEGNFSYFLEKKAEREQQEMSEVEKAKNLMRKELDWMRRQPKARGTKAKYRVDAFYDLKDKASKKFDDRQLNMNLNIARQGSKVMEIDHLKKSFGPLKIIEDFNYVFKKKDRIGIVGKNGAGKSTFLNLITGLDNEYEGEIITGETTKIGYFQQDKFEFSDEMRVIDVIKEVAEVIRLADGSEVSASQLLQHFLFPVKMHYQQVSLLSGGEKKRLQLMRTLVKNPNFLILDEPTNDLDIYTLAVLEDYLIDYPGCLMIVSHDRFFMDRLIEHCFVFEGAGKVFDFPGNYSQYREYLNDKEQAEKAERKQAEARQPQQEKPKDKTRLSYKEKLEYESLEKEIEELEQKKAAIVENMNTETDHEKLAGLSVEFESLTALIEEKTERWMELAELGGG